jgi:VWFA-related protein
LRSRWSPAVALLAALTATHTVSRGQIAAPASPPPLQTTASSGEATEPRPVRVEAIVTDARGRPIVNLTPKDFTVLEDGVAQAVESAVLTTNRAVATVPAAVSGAADEVRAARERGTRVFALYLDEFHVSAGASTERVRAAVTRFIDTEVRPSDLVAVMKPMDHLTQIRFLRDREQAKKIVAGFSGRNGDYTPRSAFEEKYVGRAPAAVRAARGQIVMSGLRALASRMGELDGGLSGIVLVTEGFSGGFARSRERRLPDVDTLARAASRFRVLFYAFDPSTPSGPAAAATGAPPPSADGDADTPDGFPLASLARQSGGAVLAPGADLYAALQHVSRDLDSYYVVTYRSNAPNDGRFRRVEISAGRRDAAVRARAGYWTPLPVEQRAVAARAYVPPVMSLRPIRRSPLIESWFGSMIDGDGNRRAIFTWTPAAPTPAAKPAGRADLVSLKVSTPSGRVLFEGDVAPAHTNSVVAHRSDSAAFEAPAGRLLVDLTIRRADGSQLDTGTLDYELPEFTSSEPVILQPQFFRAGSAREFRELAADAAAAPLPSRQFRRTDRLLVRVPTYEPRGREVQVSVKLINRTGQVLAQLSPTPGDLPAKVSQFDVPLAQYAPGEYSLELAAQSDSGVARQLVRIRITG